ncbi:MAG: class I SAM-dependent methyltransferase [Pseudomonadota bacterium]
MTHHPETVVDFGCGSGALLRRLRGDGIRSEGLEPDKDQVLEAERADLTVHHATAEHAPFADNSFDWVVSEFTAHHFADLPAVCQQAGRIARKGVAFLDQWYDPAIPSQQVAAGFDRFCKKIDRASGMIHNDSLSTDDLFNMVQQTIPQARIELQTMLVPIPIPMEELQMAGEKLLRTAQPDTGFREEFAAICQQARAHGMTDDGASLMFATID